MLGLSNGEIDHLISLLQKIRSDNDQHFHFSSDWEGKPGVGNIEIYVKGDDQKDNMSILSIAIKPNSEAE